MLPRYRTPARVTVARMRPRPTPIAELYVEQDQVAADQVESVRVFARQVAHWQFRGELAIVTLAGLAALPEILTALQVWWHS